MTCIRNRERVTRPASRWIVSLAASCALTGTLAGAFVGTVAGQDRDTKVRNDRDRFADQSNWIYNNYPQAREAARQSGKPILAVLRCIP